MDDSPRSSLGNRIRRQARERRSGGEPGTLPRNPTTALHNERLEHEHERGPDFGFRRGLCLPDGWLFGLLVPAEPDRSFALLMLRDQATSLSDALGGVLLDETAVDGRPIHRCWLYLDVARHTRRLPRNQRLHHLATDLGWPSDRSGDWLGPALITGRDLHWADRDIPSIVVAAALHGSTGARRHIECDVVAVISPE